jgi:hypothetical protein
MSIGTACKAQCAAFVAPCGLERRVIPESEIGGRRNSFSFVPLPVIARLFQPATRKPACLKTTPAV